MLIVLITICAFCIGISLGIYFFRLSTNNNYNICSFDVLCLSDYDLIKQFNNYIAKICKTKNTQDVTNILHSLQILLKEYKQRKISEFNKISTTLSDNKNQLESQIICVNSQIEQLTKDAKSLISNNMSDEDYELGGMYMVQIDETKRLKDELQLTILENEKQIENINKQIKTFEIKCTIKEGTIANMIVKSKTHPNIYIIDLDLNDLFSDLTDKVKDIEIEQNIKSQFQEINSIHKEDYINQFKNMVNKQNKKIS